jgi:hypothetical protein
MTVRFFSSELDF